MKNREPHTPADEGGDRLLIERIRQAMEPPRLSDDERNRFDDRLAERTTAARGTNPLRLLWAGGALALAAGLLLLLVLVGPGGGGPGGLPDGGRAALGELAAVPADRDPAGIWLETMVAPLSDEHYLAMMDPEYQAIATWLVSGNDASPFEGGLR